MGARFIVISLAFASCNREQAPDAKPIAASSVPSPGAEQLLKPKDWVVFVEHKENFRPPNMVKFPLPAKVTERDVWTSTESECACKAEFYQDGQQFNFSCTLPNEHRVQAVVSCRTHAGKEQALELFMCRNFRLWCESRP